VFDMKIAVSSTGPDLDAQVDPRFGRAQYLLVVDTHTLEFEALQNPNVAAGGGAGIQTAQMIAAKGAQAVLTGNCGPNAYQTLSAAGIKVYVGVAGAVREAVERLKRGEFQSSAGASVPGHFGLGMGAGMAGAGFGRGMVLGGGRGMGGGMGRGGGRGSAPAVPTPALPRSASEELDALKREADSMRKQLEDIMGRIERLESQ
jgi:predicted Fe-Mo cluster-binding NifX family protein